MCVYVRYNIYYSDIYIYIFVYVRYHINTYDICQRDDITYYYYYYCALCPILSRWDPIQNRPHAQPQQLYVY